MSSQETIYLEEAQRHPSCGFTKKRVKRKYSPQSLGIFIATILSLYHQHQKPTFVSAFSFINNNNKAIIVRSRGLHDKTSKNIIYNDSLFRILRASIDPLRHVHRKSSMRSTTADHDNATTTTASISRDDLKKFTVKQLKEKIKAMDLPVKTSHLKLKADLIEFLYQQYQTNGVLSSAAAPPSSSSKTTTAKGTASPTTTTNIAIEKSKPVQRKSPKNRRMPPMVEEETIESTSPDGEKKVLSPKDVIFEHCLRQYPPLRKLQNIKIEQEENGTVDEEISAHMHPSLTNIFTGLGDLDVRQKHHPMLAGTTSSDLDIVTVGTASCIPGVTRGVSCTALRLQWRRDNGRDKRGGKGSSSGSGATGGIWIFDCGESTQLQIQRTGSIRPGKINKIFITHAHGDHSFGLPGLMCILGQDRDRDGPPLEIYGPEGLRLWLRASIRYSVSRIVPPYRVHELMDIPMAPEWSQSRYRDGRYFHENDHRSANRAGRGDHRNSNRGRGAQRWKMQGLAGEDPVSWISRSPMLNLEVASKFGEIPGGRDIYPIYDHPKCVDGAPIWEVEDEGDVRVFAAPMSHGVPCVGYVVEEETKPGRLRNDLVEPIVKRNLKGLKAAGMRIPMKVMATIKDLKEGESYTFPDGTVVHQSDVVQPPREGRKIVICGDTADSRAIAGLGQGADVLIHEATNAFLSGIDKDTNAKMMRIDAKKHGHCTPICAGEFAKQIGAKHLIMNHFSARYKGDQSLESISVMTRMEHQAMKSSGLAEDKVAAAWDFMIFPVPNN